MSKALIERLREAAAQRVASTAMIGAEDLSAAADALEQIDAAYASAVEAGKSLAQQALKAEQERDCAVRALTRAGHMLAEGAAEWKPPIGPAATPLLDKIDKISADRDALAAKLAAANSFYARDIGIRDKEISVLREKTMARFANEDCWIFQGDGNDHLESLVCPVVIMPTVLGAIIKGRDALAAELKALRARAIELEAETKSSEEMQTLKFCEREWSTERAAMMNTIHALRNCGDAHPVHARELTDETIQRHWDEACKDTTQTPGWSRHIRFARAIERYLKGEGK